MRIIKENVSYVYRHIRDDINKPFYIGVGAGRNYERSRSKYSRNKYWINITTQTTYTIEILLDNLSPEYALLKEIEFISLYGRKDLGTGSLVNMTEGGETSCMKGRKQSKEHVEKRAEKRRGFKVSEETKEKNRIASKGIKQSKETIEKRVSKLRGVKRFDMTEERKKRISDTLKNHPNRELLNEKSRVPKKEGFIHGRLGKKNSIEHKNKQLLGVLKFIYKIKKPNGEIETIINLAKFRREHKLSSRFLYTFVGIDPCGKYITHCKGFSIISKIELTK